MDEEEHLSFFLEWHDPQADQLKPYILHFYSDETLELIERKSRRVFLKRIRIPTVSRRDLFIGASVTVYSRQLTILEAANEFTRLRLQQHANKGTIVILPKGYHSMGKILTAIEQSGANGDEIQIVNTLMLQFDSGHLPVLTSLFVPQLSLAQLQQQLVTKDVSLVVELKLSTSNSLEEVKAKLDAKSLSNLILVAELGLDRLLSCGPVTTTAVLDNCSLCLIRPRLLRERRVGEIVDEILGAGFEISALKLIHLKTEEADELFNVYKGIWRLYQEVIKYMTSAPCVAIEVRSQDAVQTFRELCGPHDVEIARAIRPTSIRARFGKNNLHNAVHCTDCPEDGVLETQYVFTTLS